jgi:predicted nucleic acid-binding protein
LKLLFDTNVVLDVMLARQPHALQSAKVVAAAETGLIEGSLCATTITTIHYLAAKAVGAPTAVRQITQLLKIFQVASVTGPVLHAALSARMSDFEDAVLIEAARSIGVDGIITRNPKDFSTANLAIYSPSDVLTMLKL